MNCLNNPHQIKPTALTTSAFAVAIFFAALAAYLFAAARRGELFSPPLQNGDEVSYERLGYNLASGLGFGYCPNDTQATQAPVSRCQANCTKAEFEVSAFRPPGFPFFVASIYWFSPLNYFAVRCGNCVCLALAVTVVAIAFFRHFSRFTGIFVGLLCCFDPRLHEYAGTFMTENLATLMLSLFALAMSRFAANVTLTNACLCGLALSGLTFTRTFYTVWYPVLWILVLGVCVIRVRIPTSVSNAGFFAFLVFALSSIALIGPWWLRNCFVLQAIMPTGTQGGIGIVDGFSDIAYKHQGNWTPKAATEIENQMRADPVLRELSGIDFEKEHCRRGMAQAKAWIKAHPREVVHLTIWKISKLWEYGNPRQMLLLASALLGIFVTRRQPLSRVLFVLLILNTLTVMATYHTYERFLTPFRPLINGMAGCWFEWLVCFCGSLCRRKISPAI